MPMEFQSPRSGKFVSNINKVKECNMYFKEMFQSPRSGKFVSDLKMKVSITLI